MRKKLVKFFAVSFIILAVLLVGAFFTLKKMYPPTKLKQMAQTYVSKKLHRELTFDSISFTWIGFTLTNVALSENTSFKDGTFISANNLTAHVAVKPLLKKRIEISTIEANGLTVNILAKKDGSYNFDSLIPSSDDNSSTPQTDESSSQTDESSLVITAQKIKLTDCDLVYQDEQSDLRTALESLDIEITNFDLNNPFDTTLHFTTDISGIAQSDLSLPVTIQFTTFLANLNLPQAYATISNATAHYKTIKFNMRGEVKNFESPVLDLTGSLVGINNKVLNELAPGLPNFSLPKIDLSLKATADLDTQSATISQAKLSVQDSSLTTQGTLAWNTPNTTYNLAGSLTAIVGQLVQMTDTLGDFKPTGTITSNFKATEKRDYTDVSGNIALKDVSLFYDPFTLTQLNGNIQLHSLEHISSSNLAGKLNGESFTGSFSYQDLSTIMNIVLNLNLDKLVLAKFPQSSADSTSSQSADTSSSAPSNADTATTPMNIQANVVIGDIKIPYLQSTGLTLAAKLTQVTETMDHANGTVNFVLKPGKITNLDNFIKDSKIAKILLLPVAVVKKVAGFLKLNLFPAQNEDGATIAFTEGVGDYTFQNGVMRIDKTVFNSSVTNISATGTANFQTDALDMKAKATLLTQAAPVSVKITGTMSDPKGKLDVVNTVTSVVGGILNGTAVKSTAHGTASLGKGTATTASHAVKDTVSTTVDVVKEIGSLFKKKDPNKK